MNTGRTYTLTDPDGISSLYFERIRDLADRFLEMAPGEADLRRKVRSASTWGAFLRFFPGGGGRIPGILRDLDEALAPYLVSLRSHLDTLSLADRMDKTLRTGREQYLLYMLEIELTNRLNRRDFSGAPWKMALMAHCLRDFRDACRLVATEVESRCGHCTGRCHIHLGSEMLRRQGIHPYVSVSMDQNRLLRKLKEGHPHMGVLGIACVPELVMGMRLCEGLGIPALGVPLDANRCSRWLGECRETTFNLEELERLVTTVSDA